MIRMIMMLLGVALVASSFSVPARAAGEPARLVVIGDSLARQYCRGVRRAADKERFSTECWVAHSSGLSRPDFHDWPSDLSRRLANDPADMAIVAFGANDAQRIIAEGVALDTVSAPWLAEYRRRVDEIISLLDASGVDIWWVGLPAVRDRGFDAKLSKLDQVYREAAEAANVHFIDLRAMTRPSGGYTDNLSDASGSVRRARDSDGVHFTRFGEDLVAGWLLGAANDVGEPTARP